MLNARLVITLLSFLALLSGCRSEPEPVKIGAVLPLSGDYAIYGRAAEQGARLAVEQINSEGGILDGRSIQLVVRDNNTEPALSVRYARELIEIDRVSALLGPVSSAAREAVLEVSEQHQVPLLYGIDYEGGRYSPWLVCYSPIPSHYIDPIVPWLNETSGKRFYIFGYDYIWPHNMALAIERAVEKVGGVVVGKEFTAFGRRDFRDVLERIEAAETDNLMLIMPGPDGFAFLRQAHSLGMRRGYETLAFAADENYLSALRHTELEGIYTVLHYFNDSKVPWARAFSSSYASRFPESTATYAAKSHYDLMRLFAKALSEAGGDRSSEVLRAMQGVQLDAGSEIRMREDHHFDLPMYLARFERGGLQVQKSLGVISPPDQRLAAP